MSPDRKDELSTEAQDVRAAYRAASFDDVPPPEVDARILAAAEKARARRLHSYLPPLAMAATVVLALGLVLRLAVPTHETPPISDELERAPAPSSVATDQAAPASVTDAGGPAREVAPQPSAAPRASVAEPGAASQPQRAGRLEEIRVLPETAQNAATAQENDAALGSAALPAPDDCTRTRSMDPDAWLECIVRLLDAGEGAAARAELRAFTLAHPEYSLPEEVMRRLSH